MAFPLGFEQDEASDAYPYVKVMRNHYGPTYTLYFSRTFSL